MLVFQTELSSRPKRSEVEGSGGTCYFPPHSHAVVIRPAAAFRRHPGDHLVRVHDVAGLAMYAVGEVDVQLFAFRPFHHFIHRGRAKMLARIAKLLHATMVT